MRCIASLLAALVAGVPLLASAASHIDRHEPYLFYVGVGAEAIRAPDSGGNLDTGNLSVSADESMGSVTLYGGVRFRRYFAAEIGILPQASQTFVVTSPDLSTPVIGEVKRRAVYLSGVGFYPWNDRVSLIGKLGAHLHWAKSSDSFTAPPGIKTDRDGVNLFGGAGLEFTLTERIGIRSLYQLYNASNNDTLHTFGITTQLQF